MMVATLQNGLWHAISCQTNSCMTSLVWKPWAPPKCKTFAWLIIQNRVWMGINYKGEDGQIAKLASFVTKYKNRHPTFSSSAASLFEYGQMQRIVML
jgi:hypothetical protein